MLGVRVPTTIHLFDQLADWFVCAALGERVADNTQTMATWLTKKQRVRESEGGINTRQHKHTWDLSLALSITWTLALGANCAVRESVKSPNSIHLPPRGRIHSKPRTKWHSGMSHYGGCALWVVFVFGQCQLFLFLSSIIKLLNFYVVIF